MVVLGDRLDADFLWRLWTLLGRARRVVSNRLSTPVFYAGHLGSDIAVYGDALRLEGEDGGQNDRVATCGPSCTSSTSTPCSPGHRRHRARCRARADPAALERAARLGRVHPRAGRRLLDDVGRTAGRGQPAPQGARVHTRGQPAGWGTRRTRSCPSWQWLTGATSYLPARCPAAITAAGTPREPIEVAATPR